MQLNNGAHLAYCTNVHPAETWEETLAALNRYTLAVRENVARGRRYGIGLRLSDRASRDLIEPRRLDDFRGWLDLNDCYVFTINGFPFGRFHGGVVKERVFQPDWSSDERVAYTKRLFEILAQLLPAGIEGSVSTLPGGFKATDATERTPVIIRNVLKCATHVAELSDRSDRKLHLGFEPEPFGLFENTRETLSFFDKLHDNADSDHQLSRTVGVTYDTCHFALQYEDARESLNTFQNHGIKISKVHLSSALKAAPDEQTRETLRAFCEDTYLHQVIARTGSELTRYRDLPFALAADAPADEWRIHFHIPLYSKPEGSLQNTSDHLLDALDWFSEHPSTCTHYEMETYTWDVLPPALQTKTVVEQLTDEYRWTLSQLASRRMV